MINDRITPHLTAASEAISTFLSTLLGSEQHLKLEASEPASAASDSFSGRLVLVGHSGDSPTIVIGLDAGWLSLLSSAMLGEAIEASDEGAADLLKELAAQACGAIRSQLAGSGVKIPDVTFEFVGAGDSHAVDEGIAVVAAFDSPEGLLSATAIIQTSSQPQTTEDPLPEAPTVATPAPSPARSPAVSVAPAAFPELGSESVLSGDGANFGLLAEVELEVTVELGRRRLPLADVLRLTTGSVIELEKLVGEPLEVYANGRLIAEGEAVVIDEQFGVRITNLVSSTKRAKAFI